MLCTYYILYSIVHFISLNFVLLVLISHFSIFYLFVIKIFTRLDKSTLTVVKRRINTSGTA